MQVRQAREPGIPPAGARSARTWPPPAGMPRRPGRARRAKKPRATRSHGAVEKEVGSALLSRAPERSIIAAGALNGRVRDGNGCFSPARAANQRVSAGRHMEEQPCPAGRQRPRPPALIAPRPRARICGRRGGGQRTSLTAYQNPSAERVATLAPGACQPGSLPGAFRTCVGDGQSPGRLGA